jgi:O-antigen ligase
MPSITIFVLITLPWLNPFSPGPMPAAVPLMFSWACAAALIAGCGFASGRFDTERLVRAVAGAWLFAALLSALLGLLQYFGATAMFEPWVNGSAMGEAFANLRQRNQFATLTSIGLAALLWWVANDQSRRVSSGEGSHAALRSGWQVLPIAAALLLGAGNAASSSRTGLLQWGVLMALAWLWGGWRQAAARRVLLAAAVAYAVAALALPGLLGQDLHTTGIVARLQGGDPICASRLTLWRNVLHLIAQKPWLGWGWGELDYAHFITLYPGARFCDILDNAHNLPLHLAVELGVPVAVLLCGGGLWLVGRAHPWREADATRQMAWSVLAVILLHSLLEYPLWYGPFQMAFGLALWMLWRATVGTGAHARPLGVVIGAWLAVSLFVSLGYAAWDYHRISQIYLAPSMRAAAYRDNTLQKIGDSWLFRGPVHFAELTTTPLRPDNAAHVRDLATELLHFSPEPRVIEKLIESDVILGRDDEARFYLARYRAAFPENHARWAKENMK